MQVGIRTNFRVVSNNGLVWRAQWLQTQMSF